MVLRGSLRVLLLTVYRTFLASILCGVISRDSFIHSSIKSEKKKKTQTSE